MIDIIERARAKVARAKEKKEDPRFIRAIEWLSFLGVLRTNFAKPRKSNVQLQDLLFASEIEPRVSELLPALLIELEDILPFSIKRLPKDLKAVIAAYKSGQTLPPYKGVAPRKYNEWFNAPAIEHAYRRLHPRAQPRNRKNTTTEFAEVIRTRRLKLGFTQVDFSKAFGTSLRALRDLEQNKMTASIDRVNEILAPLSLTLSLADLPNKKSADIQ